MEGHANPYLLHFMIGALLVGSFLLRHFFEKLGVQTLISYLLMGVAITAFNSQFHMLGDDAHRVMLFMANLGLLVLLFRTGLESDTKALKDELGPAGLIWLGNFFLSGILGYLAAYYILGLSLVTSLVIATGFTATSIAVSIGIWREAGLMNRRESNLLLNVAQMDDVSGVAALALLLALVPILEQGGSIMDPSVFEALGIFALSLFVFSLGCYLFARYAEAPITEMFQRISKTDSCLMLLTVGTGFMIASIAEGLEISLAVGALFAGLVFSKNPKAHEIDNMIIPIYNLFAPFFFIGMGMAIEPELFLDGIGIGLILLIPSVLGKVLGGAIPALRYLNWNNAMALGISLVPRAEIMLVIAGSAKAYGPEVLPDEVFAGLVFVSAITCVLTPVVVKPYLRKMEQQDAAVST
ncbi:MAG: cation:proton antiporter [Alphaproteobacteria bacterium]|nr:cation:proton antiporter [Alphaproteobacteria bacterium]MCB9974003.1 cation:proton antiporter [Rhodospirillales bacterium]